MIDPHAQVVEGSIVEEAVRLTLEELCRACSVPPEQIVILVEEGVLAPGGSGPADWRFAGPSLRRARVAVRLVHDLELGVGEAAIVLDLLDEIESLRARLRRAGLPYR